MPQRILAAPQAVGRRALRAMPDAMVPARLRQQPERHTFRNAAMVGTMAMAAAGVAMVARRMMQERPTSEEPATVDWHQSEPARTATASSDGATREMAAQPMIGPETGSRT